MKAVKITKYREPVVIRDVPKPEPGPNDALVKVEACGICRSDWHSWHGDFSWIGLSPELPITPGHEFGGVIEKLGANVQSFKVGDRVTAPFHWACGHCEYCKKGNSNLCVNIRVYGMVNGLEGAYAEYILIPNAEFNLIQLPENVDSVTAAAAGCRYMTGYHGVLRGNVQPGDWVAVYGAGGVGLSAIQVANAIGAQVIAVDIDDGKLELAEREGAVATVNAKKVDAPSAIREITKGGAHVSLDALGIKETIQNSVFSLRKGGRHVQIGLTTSDEQGMVDLPVDFITSFEIEFVGSLGNPHPDYRGLLDLIASGRLNPSRLVERKVSLSNVSEVFESMNQYKTKGFNVITKFE